LEGAAVLSVIVCTHDPKPEYLERVLAALRAQSLAMEAWELLLVDNASATPLGSVVDLSWQRRSMHVREERLGLTHARLRGIAESSGEILVFVDDDNVLHLDYLEQVQQIGEQRRVIGAWSGQLYAEFEVEPQPSVRPYLNIVGIRQFDHDEWSTFAEPTPYGAGLCVRRSVAVAWAARVHDGNPLRMALDPHGEELLRCGDIDLALTAGDIGLGTGVFTALRLTHIIPARRVQTDYLLKLQEGNGYSHEVLSAVRGQPQAPEPRWRIMGRRLRILLQRNKMRREFHLANDRGRQRARIDIRRVLSEPH